VAVRSEVSSREFTLGTLRSWQFIHFFSNLLVVAITWSILELGHTGAYGLGSRPSAAGQIANERERWVMFLDQDPYIPPRHKRHGFELVARGGSGIERAFRACRALFSAIRCGIHAVLRGP
jgi:hypothetical protein